jgi:hypothetical protein
MVRHTPLAPTLLLTFSLPPVSSHTAGTESDSLVKVTLGSFSLRSPRSLMVAIGCR